MGWLFRNHKLRHETPADYFRREMTHSSEKWTATVLDAAAVKGTVYAAVPNQDHKSGDDYVFCAVILFKNNDRDGFGYKDMTECMGPCEVDCPDRIMKLLSPVEKIPNASYAADWRLRVAAARESRKACRQVAERLKPGVIIRIPQEATFGKTGVTATEFRLRYMRKRTPIFEPVGHPGFLCRLHKRTLETVTILPSSTADVVQSA